MLTRLRCELVAKYWDGRVIDIGIGGGRFVSDRPCFGYDINPLAVDWLKHLGLYRDPYVHSFDAATFWDSLEHIHDPSPLLKNVRRWAFVSTPIYRDAEDVLQSKHYKPAEHCWYMTSKGINRFMGMFEFELVEANTMEQAAGRQQIETFVFRRKI